MVARIEKGDAAKILRNMAAAGKPMPAWAKGDPELENAYRDAVPVDDDGVGAKAPVNLPAKKPASTRPAAPAKKASPVKAIDKLSRPTRRGGYLARATSPAAGLRYAGVTSAGDGGGAFLALVLYPLVLSAVKYGAKGPGIWFRAKWLNQTTSQPNNLPSTGSK